jgi:hypothetical protein
MLWKDEIETKNKTVMQDGQETDLIYTFGQDDEGLPA